MAETDPVGELKHRVRTLEKTIYFADVAHALSKEIGANAEGINAARLGNMFGLGQIILAEHFTISLTKLFERQSSRNPVLSIASTLHFMETHARDLPLIERTRITGAIEELGVDPEELANTSDPEFTRTFVQLIQMRLPDVDRAGVCPLSSALGTWRASRDRRVVHSEDMRAVEFLATTWGSGLGLLNYAKYFVSAVGWGYLNLAYTFDDGRYHLTDDAESAARALRRLLEMANVRAGDVAG